MTTKTKQKNTLKNVIQAYNKYLKDPFKIGGVVSFKLKENQSIGPIITSIHLQKNNTLKQEIISKLCHGSYYLYNNLNQGKIIAIYDKEHDKEIEEPLYLVKYKGSNGRFAVYPFFKKNLKAYKDNEQPK